MSEKFPFSLQVLNVVELPSYEKYQIYLQCAQIHENNKLLCLQSSQLTIVLLAVNNLCLFPFGYLFELSMTSFNDETSFFTNVDDRKFTEKVKNCMPETSSLIRMACISAFLH
jgi:hypothetical protein